MKLLRTIRFDASDEAVYQLAAPAGEWAVSGAFAFAALDQAAITGKTRQAFANGFLGVPSLGRSTFVTIAEANETDRADLAMRLALHFVASYGAPGLAEAMPAAEEEIAFAASLADGQPINTVLTVRRVHSEDGTFREEFRTIRPPSGVPLHARIWMLDGDDA